MKNNNYFKHDALELLKVWLVPATAIILYFFLIS